MATSDSYVMLGVLNVCSIGAIAESKILPVLLEISMVEVKLRKYLYNPIKKRTLPLRFDILENNRVYSIYLYNKVLPHGVGVSIVKVEDIPNESVINPLKVYTVVDVKYVTNEEANKYVDSTITWFNKYATNFNGKDQNKTPSVLYLEMIHKGKRLLLSSLIEYSNGEPRLYSAFCCLNKHKLEYKRLYYIVKNAMSFAYLHMKTIRIITEDDMYKYLDSLYLDGIDNLEKLYGYIQFMSKPNDKAFDVTMGDIVRFKNRDKTGLRYII